jgi:rod shape determining protein RodA
VPAVDRRLIQNFEWPLLAMALGLAAMGIVNLISAAPGAYAGVPDAVSRQLTWLGLGVVGLLVAVAPDYRRLDRFAIPIYALCVALLLAVPFLAPVIKGSQRWISLGPAHLQPSELAKLGLVVVLARVLQRRASSPELGLRQLGTPLVLVAPLVVLVLRQPDLGTALLLALVAGSYLPLSRVRFTTLLFLGAAGLAAAGSAWLWYLHDYQKERILTFLNPERDPLGTAYHAIQSQIAVGSGGLFGKGYLRGPQSQLDFLPEQQTDFVFSVLAEEWGFLGAGLVLLLYLAMLLRGLMIARASKDVFGAYLAVGVVAMLFWPAAINVAMVLGLAPVVGVALPLLSYGGSALITTLLGIGLLMNVSMRRYVF